MSDVVVIGAGLGGLAAAISLAVAGLDVEVHEAGGAPGGKAGVVRIDGVEVDTGPSVLTLPDLFDGVLRPAGTTLADEVTLRRPDPAFRYRWPDGTVLDVHPDREATLASVAATLGAEAADDLRGFLDQAARIWEVAAPRFVLAEAPSLGGLWRTGFGLAREVATIQPFRSLDALVRGRVRSPHLRDLLGRFATYNGSDPRRAPATLGCIAHVELTLGGYGVEGGIGALVAALVRVAEGLGVRIHLDSPVARIRTSEGVTGVVLASGREVAARAVVCNAEVGHLVEDLLPGPAPRSLASGQVPSTSGWTAILRAERRGRVAHEVVFPADYTAEFSDLFDRARAPSDPAVYLCAQEVAHGRAGWPEAEPLFVMVNAPPRPDLSAETWVALRDRVLDRLRAQGRIAPTDRVVWERNPAGLAARFAGSRGSLYGAASNGMLAAFQRPPNRVRGVPGLYLASGSAHPGGGMPLCVQSGHLAARALLEDSRR